MTLRVWLVASIALAVGGCDFAPRYSAPAVSLPAKFRDQRADGVDLSANEEWWRSFNDRTLDDLQAQVDAANPNLAAAIAADEVAKARAEQALAGLFPEINGIGQVTANKQSANRPLRSKGQPDYYGNNILGAQVSYEIDIWGRVRDLAKAADATAEASAAALANARLELHAELARDYVNLRGIDDEAKLLSNTIGIYRSSLELTQSLLAAKIVSPADVDRAQTQLSSAEAQVSDLALRRAQLEDSIAALVGKAAPAFSIPRSSRPLPLPKRPRAVPADVLRRRPDVAEQERLTAAANQGIGSARANLFPKFTLLALGGTQDTGFNLFNRANLFGTIGPSFDLPLFDAGLRRAELDVAKAEFTQAAENYRAAVLRAVQEVDDNLTALRWLAVESRQTATAAEAARKTAQLSTNLYRAGASSFLEVATAQSAALESERLTIALHTRELEADIGLMLALGGGWTASPELPAPSPDLDSGARAVGNGSHKGEAMTADRRPPPNCSGCAFWRKLRENEGVCCRHAPTASNRPEEVAHWPQTHSRQWCGEGIAAGPLSIGSRCEDCVYWRHPEGGLNPVNRGDMPMAWWAKAGICARHAPSPISEPGPRAFWRATQNADFCGEGLGRERTT